MRNVNHYNTMSLLPYQERVIAEKAELVEKTQKLREFLEACPSHVDEEERRRLTKQLCAMQDYSGILGQRIDAFPSPREKAPTMVAKFEVRSVTTPHEGTEALYFAAVTEKPFDKEGYSDDNSFAKWSPTGDLKMTVTNPALHGKIQQGEKYYLHFTKA